jgi:Tfp pilus assembly protein PilE
MSQQPSSAAAIPPAKTSGLAIASLVCGIAGFCTVGLGSIAGIILGVMGLGRIRRSIGQVGGRGIAIAGIITSVVGLLLWIVVAVISVLVAGLGFATLQTAVEQAQGQMARVNMMHLCRAANQYAAENNDRFPPPDSWPQALKDSHAIEGDQAMTDPADPNAGRIFAMNAALRDVKMSNVTSPSQTVLFFECGPGGPMCGGLGDLPPTPRRSSGYLIGFCDGHVEDVRPDKIGLLIWDPKAETPPK